MSDSAATVLVEEIEASMETCAAWVSYLTGLSLAGEAAARVVVADAGEPISAPVIVLEMPTVTAVRSSRGGWDLSGSWQGYLVLPASDGDTARADYTDAADLADALLQELAADSLESGTGNWQLVEYESDSPYRIGRDSGYRPGQMVVPFRGIHEAV